MDSASVNPVNIVTIGAFATVVVSGMMGFIYWITKQHQKQIDSVVSRFESLQQGSNDTGEKVASSMDHLKESVDALTAKSKTETDYATLLLEVFKAQNKKE